MESKKGYFIDIVNGKVETAEEHDKKVRADEIEKFAEWFKENNHYLCYNESIDDVVAEYEKEQKNG